MLMMTYLDPSKTWEFRVQKEGFVESIFWKKLRNNKVMRGSVDVGNSLGAIIKVPLMTELFEKHSSTKNKVNSVAWKNWILLVKKFTKTPY